MRATVSSTFTSLAKTGVLYTWKIYMRKTTSRSEALDSGTAWTEVTRYIDMKSFQGVTSKIEAQITQFVADSLKLVGSGIAWWDANILTLSAGQNIECKVTYQIIGASDVLTVFSGWVDTKGLQYNEIADTVTMTIFTAEELGNRMPAENVTAQPIKKLVDGTNDGLILANLTNLYVIDAGISGKEAEVGTHTIRYRSVGGKYNFDDGLDTVPGTNPFTLSNAAGTQQVKCYVNGSLPTGDTTDKFVVVTFGNKLPRRYYKNVQSRYLLSKLFTAIGVTSQNFDTLEFNTYDGAKRLTSIESPPNNDGVVVGEKRALETDGTNLFIGACDNVYRRDPLTGISTLLITGAYADKLMYNARNNHLWVLSAGTLKRYNLTTGNLSSGVTVSSNLLDVALYDYNYTGSSWKYGVCWTVNKTEPDRGYFYFLDGTFTDGGGPGSPTQVVKGSTLLYTSGNGITEKFMYQISPGKVRFRVLNNSSQQAYREYQPNSSGVWTDNGEKCAGIDDYTVAGAHNSVEGRVYYYFDNDGFHPKIKSHLDGSATTTVVYDASTTNGLCSLVYFSDNDPNELVYFTMEETIGKRLYSATANTPTYLASPIVCGYSGMVYGNSRLYLLNEDELTNYLGISLNQWSEKVVVRVPTADFDGQKVSDMIRKTLNAFLHVGSISSIKTVNIYRRADDSGVPVTSGNSLAINITNTAQLQKVREYTAATNLVTVTNGVSTVKYNGTKFDAAILSDGVEVVINNDFIPTEILKDIAYYAWQFFKNPHDIYRIDAGVLPLFQFEPFDSAALTFSTTKVQKTGSGLLYSVTCGADSTMKAEVLI